MYCVADSMLLTSYRLTGPALQYVIRQISVGVNLPHIYCSGHVLAFTDGMNIVGSTVQTAVQL
jgi:hypothetical protein